MRTLRTNTRVMHACIVCESHSTYIVWSKQRQVQFLKRTCYFYPHWFWRDESQPSLAVGELGKDLHRHTYAAAVEALGTTTPGILKEGHSILKDELSLNNMVFNSAEQHGAQHTGVQSNKQDLNATQHSIINLCDEHATTILQRPLHIQYNQPLANCRHI
jgi:hypothetical protein